MDTPANRFLRGAALLAAGMAILVILAASAACGSPSEPECGPLCEDGF